MLMGMRSAPIIIARGEKAFLCELGIVRDEGNLKLRPRELVLPFGHYFSASNLHLIAERFASRTRLTKSHFGLSPTSTIPNA